MSPMDRATVCWMGFQVTSPKTATSMASPKLNTKKGKVKVYSTFFHRRQAIFLCSVSMAMPPMRSMTR